MSVLAALLVGVVAVGCSSSDDKPASTGNLLVNGDFEQGRKGWSVPPDSPEWADFTVSNAFPFDGENSAQFDLRARAGEVGTRIWGISQDIATTELPDTISGHYRVERWKRATRAQYVQFVVILFGQFADQPNLQIRYILAGTRSPPTRIDNAKFKYLGPVQPKQKQWIGFKRNLHEDFVETWGKRANDLTSMRVFFEARYDEKLPDQVGRADVYFDRLFLGR